MIKLRSGSNSSAEVSAPLKKAMYGIVAFKVVALIVLWYFCFSSVHRVSVTPAKMDQVIF